MKRIIVALSITVAILTAGNLYQYNQLYSVRKAHGLLKTQANGLISANENMLNKLALIEAELESYKNKYQEPITINYVYYKEASILVTKETSLYSLPSPNSIGLNYIEPYTVAAVEDAASMKDNEIWLYVSIPVYDSPTNYKGWIKEAHTEEITLHNREKILNGITVSKKATVYLDEPLKNSEKLSYDLSGKILADNNGYVLVSTAGGFSFWVEKKYIVYPDIK